MELKIVSVILKGFHGIMLFFSTHSQDPNGYKAQLKQDWVWVLTAGDFTSAYKHTWGESLAQSLALAPPIGALFDMDS